MAWVYLDDQMADHPKIVAAGDLAAWMFVSGLMYCRRLATNGLIPKPQVTKLSSQKRPRTSSAKLIEVGLWHDHDHACEGCPNPPIGFYVVHDYAEWNKPQESRSEAGRKAAAARWQKRSSQPEPQESQCERNADALPDASDPDANRNANASESHMRQDAHSPIPIPIPTANKSSTDSRGGPPPVDDVIEAAARIAAEHEADHHDDIRNRDRWCTSRARSIRRDNEPAWRTILEADPTTTPEQLANGNTRTPADDLVAAQMRRIDINAQRDNEAANEPPAPPAIVASALAEARANRTRARSGNDPPPAA